MFLILVKGEIERSLLENCYQCDGSWKNPRTSGSDCISATLLSDCFHGNGCQSAENGENESLETIIVLNLFIFLQPDKGSCGTSSRYREVWLSGSHPATK